MLPLVRQLEDSGWIFSQIFSLVNKVLFKKNEASRYPIFSQSLPLGTTLQI